jgi:hypothetical protein
MPASRRGAALVALILCLLPAAARADDLLVMPYACAVFGGRTVLTPGAEVGHRILGPLEERRFSACSPVNPELCRQWTVYRFDVDCDGDRVPWVSVVAAAGETGRNVRLVNGRLQLRMPPRWSLPPNDPCADAPDPDDRFSYRRMRRYCADRLAISPPVVEMPPGFAPMLGIDGIIVRPPRPVAAAPPPDASAPAGPPEQAAQPPWSEALVAKEPPAQPPPERPAVDAKPAPKAAPAPAPPATEAPKAAAPAPQPKVALTPPAPSTAQPPKPAQESASSPAAEGEGKAISLNVFNALRPATAGAIVVFAGIAVGLVIAFAMARRREQLAHAGRHRRDPASLTFDNPEADDRMPRTRAQALQVLGMAPSANPTAIKKIVDGLRVSWHPDLASDEPDRQLRELRSKQINAAWEILQRQRAEV